MSTLTGTGALLRLALRLDRVRLTVWVIILGITPAATAAQYFKLYPTEESLQAVSAVVNNPSLTALGGPLFGVSIGGITAWKIGVTEFILAGLMSLFTVIRHTRTEEETGRLELLGATVIGRYAPVTAALLTTAVANGAIAILSVLGLIATGLPAAGSIAFGLAIFVTGMSFAAVAAVAAQLTESGRAATGIAAAVLGAAFLLRVVGDTGPVAASWASPIGWGLRVRSYAGEQWWVLLLPIALTALLTGVAYALLPRRDVGAGLIPPRPAPAEAAPSLRSPFALAWRLQRGVLYGWLAALILTGALLGGPANSLSDALSGNQQMSDMLARLGGRAGIVDAYFGAVFSFVGLVIAAYTVQATLRLRTEESSGRLEPLLATRVGRIRWALSHTSLAALGAAVLLAVTGLMAGLVYGAEVNDIGGQVPRMLGAAMVQLPAAWVLGGLGLALFGLLPRWSILAWAGLVACFLVLDLGALLGLSQWFLDISPFAHVPKLPGATATAAPIIWLTAVAALLGAAGLTGFRRRDITG